VQSGKGEVVDALRVFERDNASGALDFTAQGVLTRVFVHKGTPVYAEAGVLGETLGHVLVREGIVTTEQFAAVVRKMTDAIVDDENVRFGEVIVELGILSKDELDRALAAQVEKKIIGCVTRGSGEWSFDPSREVSGGAGYQAPIRTLLVDAAKLLPEERVSTILHLDRETFPRLTQSIASVADEYGLEAHELAALSFLDGTRSSNSLIKSGAKEVDTLLAALAMGGSLELLHTAQAKVAAAPVDPINATGRRRAFRAKLVAHNKAKEAVERISKEIDAREEPLPQARNVRQATLFSEDEFQSGRKLYLAGKLEPALAKLKLATERSPTVPLYRLYELLVESRLQGSFVDAPGTKKLAIQIAKEDAECAFAFYVLAYLALEESSHESAKRYFKHAFKLDHELVDAGRQARLLEMRGESRGLALPTPLKEILPRRGSAPDAEEVKKTKPTATASKPSNTRTIVLAGVLAVVVIVAIVVLVALKR
jgi:tetratricopeptide (TPR) repeat protein